MVLGLTERVKASAEGESLNACLNVLTAPLCHLSCCEITELPDFDQSPHFGVIARKLASLQRSNSQERFEHTSVNQPCPATKHSLPGRTRLSA